VRFMTSRHCMMPASLLTPPSAPSYADGVFQFSQRVSGYPIVTSCYEYPDQVISFELLGELTATDSLECWIMIVSVYSDVLKGENDWIVLNLEAGRR